MKKLILGLLLSLFVFGCTSTKTQEISSEDISNSTTNTVMSVDFN